MTKDELAKVVWGKLEIDYKKAKLAVDTLFSLLKESLVENEDVEIRGFGKFTIRSKNSRIGRNPRTGVEVEITARKVITFKSSKVLRNALCDKS